MSSKRVYYLLVGCLVLLSCLVLAGMGIGNSVLKKSAATLNDLKLETSVIDEQQNSLSQAKRDIETYAELEQIAKTIVPQEKDQALTVREILRFAEEADVPITSITFPASDLGNAPKPGTPAGPASPDSQIKAVEGIKGVYQLEVTIQNDKDSPARYASLISFLEKLEQNRRTSQVTNVGLQPDPKNRNLFTYNMTINVYIKP